MTVVINWQIMPEILVMGGNMGSLDGLAATLTRMFKEKLPGGSQAGDQPQQ